MSLRASLGAMVLTAAAVTGCGSGEPEPGLLTVRWTIRSTYDPGQCTDVGAATIQVDVYFLDGAFAGTYAASCPTFATTIPLAPATYNASARLADPAGNPRTTSVTIAPFDISSDVEFVVDVDFPGSSVF